jgi:DNA-binding MarR family transcriptional regulator
MVQAQTGSKETLAADVWRMMAEFTWSLLRQSAAFGELKRLGLTPGHLKVLMALPPGTSLPMGVIADGVGCDPSMATWLIDRLEEQGLAARQMLPTDRRVKAVSLTPDGERFRAELLERLYTPPPEVLALDRATLSTLRRALAKLPQRELRHPHAPHGGHASDPTPASID